MPSPVRPRPLSCAGGALCLVLVWSSAAGAEPAAAASTSASVHRLLARPAELSARLEAANPDVGAARARVSEAHAEASGSRLLPNPVLDASLSAIPVSRANNSRFAASSVWSVGLSETLELGKRGPRSAAADARERAASRYLVGTLSERMAAARAAMASALHLSLRNATLEASLHDAERATELERVRYEQKALSGVDYDRLLLDLSSLEAELAKSRAEYQRALAECGALLAGSCELDDAREEDLDQALPLAGFAPESPDLGKRPDLVGLLLERDAARSDAELARRRGIPDVTVHVGYARDNSAGPEQALDSLSVGLQLPLPIADHGQHDASKALARATELEEQHRALLLGARSERSALLQKKQALEHTLSVLERDSLPRAKSVLESTQRAFDDGGIALTDFLLARRSYVALRLTLLEQRFELSPREGVVIEKSVLPAQQVDSGTPLISVADLSSVRVIADLFEADAGGVARGEKVRITSPSLPGFTLDAEIELVSSVADPERHTVAVWARLPNPDGRIRPNAYAEMRLSRVPPAGTLEVPTASLVSDGAHQYVYVEESQGHFVRRPVVAGASRDDHLLVYQGLKSGEAVVEQGAVLLDNQISLIN